MAQIKLHGNPFSTATMRATAAIYEKDLEFEFVPVDMKSGAHKQEPFLSLNPFGQVPAFEDGDLKLFESRAITKYIAYEYENKGTQLVCKESKEMAMMAVWMEVEAHQFEPIVSKLAWELVYKKMFGLETEEAVVKELEDKLGKVLDVYEARLAQAKYLAGDSFSLADLHHLPAVYYLMGTQIKQVFEQRTHVGKWCTDILARSAWSKVIALQKQA